jgi:exodeoxyribonuclease V alpha subunit
LGGKADEPGASRTPGRRRLYCPNLEDAGDHWAPWSQQDDAGQPILKILDAKAVAIALCAPTGRAAKRLSECTGLEAKTIHRQLETDPRTGRFRRNEDAPLDCVLLVVDETSMVDVPLMRAVQRALPEGAALLLVGDVDQLPSVGPGQVLADAMVSGG